MIKTNFLKNENIGIWSKHNGIEWGNELKWKSRLPINRYQDTSYAYAISNKHSLTVEIEDLQLLNHQLLLRKFTLHNESNEKQDIKVFFQQDLDYRNGTALFSLSNRTLYHEYEGCYMLFNGFIDNEGISQYTTWQKSDFYKTNVVNTETGSLLFNPIAAGRIKSAFSLETCMLPYEIKHGYYWMVVGKDLNEANALNQVVRRNPEWLVKEFIDNNFCLDKIVPLSN